jgi:hypothetical protein
MQTSAENNHGLEKDAIRSGLKVMTKFEFEFEIFL